MSSRRMGDSQSNYEAASDALADVDYQVMPQDKQERALVAIGYALMALVDAIEAARRPTGSGS